MNNHNALFACEALIPLNQFGDPEGSFGYEFDNDGDGVNPFFFTSALDVTTEDDPTAAWFIVDDCAASASPRKLARKAHLRPHTSGLQP